MICVKFIFILIFTFKFCVSTLDKGYCHSESKICNIQDVTKWIFYDVNPPEGFNLRRDVFMRFAIMLSGVRKSSDHDNWNLVLPPWHSLYHWKEINSEPLPWSTFFDVESIKKFAPVTDLNELFNDNKDVHFQLDRLYILLNYDDPFEGGTFKDKWEISSKGCYYDGNYWGYRNISSKEIVCIKFQGKISKLREVMMLHPNDKRVMFSHGEIPLHDSYGDKVFWDCRKSMKFCKNLVNKAKHLISKFFNCETDMCQTYISLHWRRQDFVLSRRNDVPSLQGTVNQIKDFVKKHKIDSNKIFVASDASIAEREQLKQKLKNISLEAYFFLPTSDEIESFKDGGVAIIDQIICSHAAFFIGTHESTFSYRIQEEREILGFKSDTTFNRLCPDSGSCEKPSKWYIIH